MDRLSTHPNSGTVYSREYPCVYNHAGESHNNIKRKKPGTESVRFHLYSTQSQQNERMLLLELIVSVPAGGGNDRKGKQSGLWGEGNA